MPSRLVLWSCVVISVALGACAARFPVPPPSPPAGLGPKEILERSIEASGGDPYESLSDVAVAYRGEWGTVVQVLQPALTDGDYRRSSEERFLLREETMAQVHRGPGGQKEVLRNATSVDVAYDGARTTEQDLIETSALVADAYTLFLLGPAWLRRHGEEWQRLEDEAADGRSYFLILGRFRPGVGLSKEDEIVAWIDQETFRLHRVHFTLEGHVSTQGAHADVTFFDYRERFDRWWPTRFIERVRGPVDIHAHEWWMTGLDVNRGLEGPDLGTPGKAGWSDAAKEPARAL